MLLDELVVLLEVCFDVLFVFVFVFVLVLLFVVVGDCYLMLVN